MKNRPHTSLNHGPRVAHPALARWLEGRLSGQLIVAASLLMISACTDRSEPPATSFFPLAEGRSWTYRVTTRLDDAAASEQREVLRIDSRGMDPIDGNEAWRRRSDSGIEYWIRHDRSGIYRVASRTPLQAEPVADDPIRYVLKWPLEVGTTWESSTTGYVLQKTNEVPKEIRRTHKPFPMRYTIAAVGETVKVPAGEFAGCIRVDGLAFVRVYVEAEFAWRDTPLHGTEWFCPNVGLVKSERREASPTRFMVGGTTTLELAQFKR